MKRISLFSVLAIVVLSLSVSAQDTLSFIETHEPVTIAEGEVVIWFVSVHDSNYPDDSIYMYVDPPPSDPGYKGDLTFESFDDSTYNFKFDPFYDLIAGGDSVFQMTIYATDFTDTISMPVSITVLNNNPAPILRPIGDHRIVEGVLFTWIIKASDPDNSIPLLQTSTLPANAAFIFDTLIDSNLARGTFTFLPDETQYGDSAQEYDIFFDASDEDSTTSELVTITVTGPNVAPVLELIGSQSVTEGDTLSFTITATDFNETDIRLYTSPLSDGMDFIDSSNGTGLFIYMPDYLQAGFDTVTFYADDGSFIDSEKVEIEVLEAGNQPPYFDFMLDDSVAENSTLDLIITAFDPEDGTVTITLPSDTLDDWFSFTDISSNSGIFSLTPGLTDGGTYDFLFVAIDQILGLTEMTLRIKVIETDWPPNLNLEPSFSSYSMDEGEILRIDLMAVDTEQVNLEIIAFPPVDSAIFKGKASLTRLSDSTAFFEFAPDYNQIIIGTDSSYILTFSTYDSVETITRGVIITVYNVEPDDKDPGQADTLTLMSGAWDKSKTEFSITTRIWNDSAIGAAMTGFRWSEPWLECDSVKFGPRLDSAFYRRVYIYNDSMAFLTTFIFYDSLFLAPGDGEFFTAFFSYDTLPTGEIFPDSIEAENIASIIYDTTKVGSSGEFFFDKRIRGEAPANIADDELFLSLKSPFTYKPLIKLGATQSALDRVKLEIFDVASEITLGNGSVLYMLNDEEAPAQYELRLSLENQYLLDTMLLDFTIYSNDGAAWAYNEPPVAITPTSRMFPDAAVWEGSTGLQVSAVNMDGLLHDTLRLKGIAGSEPVAGLSPGLMEYMISLPFTVGGVSGEEVKTVCFDALLIDTLAGPFLFVDKSGNAITPDFYGQICLPVEARSGTAVDDETIQTPRVYSLSQNYPNPFNPSTAIRFSLAGREKVTITLYNILGQVVTTLADRVYNPGTHTVTWDGRDSRGQAMATGIYLYHFMSEGFTETKKMILLR